MDNCRLCGKESELCKSHIIPEFMYTTLYDDNHKFKQMTSDRIVDRPKGIYEKMLCRDCEDRLKINEDYVSKVFQGGSELIFQEEKGHTSIINIDYDKFKLFNLSVLWRAGITGRKEFLDVELGRKHEEKLREMINNDNPGKPYEYPCIIIYNVNSTPEINQGLVTNLHKSIRYEGHMTYRVFMAGCIWIFLVSSHTNRIDKARHLWLDDRGLIIHKISVSEEDFLRTLMSKLR